MNLVLRISVDDGRTFPIERPVAVGHATYSDLTVLDEGSLGVLWERGHERGYQYVTFTRLPSNFLDGARP